MAPRPGFLARWRARGGVHHPRGKVGVGYTSVFSSLTLTRKELGHHGLVLGSTGSGKTTALAQIIQGHERLGPCVVLDAKGSGTLQDAVRAAGGLVWTLGGRLKLDLLDPDPTVMADQLTEATRHDGPSEVFTEAAARAVQWAAHVLRWEGAPATLQAVEALLQPGALAAALRRHSQRPRVDIWRAELDAARDVELSGMATALMRVTRLLDSAAGPSLGTGPDAIRLEDVVQGKTTFLISLDSRRYPSLARILGGWALIAMQRACLAVPKTTASCLMVVDEIASLGAQAKRVEPLLALARDQHVGVVIAAHGPSQIDAAMGGLTTQILQDTAWQLILAQGDPDDADRLSRLFPLKDDGKQRLGKVTTGSPTVTRDHLMWLATGDACFRVRPVDGLKGRWGRARVALPKEVPLGAQLPIVVAEKPAEEAPADLTVGNVGITEEIAEDRSVVYRHVRVINGWRTWIGNFDADGYPRAWLPWQKRYVQAHRVICEWEHGPIPKGWTVDHVCDIKACVDHLEACTRAENLRRRHARARGELPTGHEQFTVAA